MCGSYLRFRQASLNTQSGDTVCLACFVSLNLLTGGILSIRKFSQ